MFKQVVEEAAQFAGVTLTVPVRTRTPAADAPGNGDLDVRPAAQSSPTTTSRIKKVAAYLLMHIDELDSLPPIRWLIKDYLPEDSLVEVYGAPSAGKTQIVFDMS
jgi:hypothetical protein